MLVWHVDNWDLGHQEELLCLLTLVKVGDSLSWMKSRALAMNQHWPVVIIIFQYFVVTVKMLELVAQEIQQVT